MSDARGVRDRMHANKFIATSAAAATIGVSFRHSDQPVQCRVVVQQVLASAAVHDLTAIHHQAAVRIGERDLELLLHHQDGKVVAERIRAIAATTSCTTSGANPSTGSSSSSTDGLVASARAMASICCFAAGEVGARIAAPNTEARK